MTASPDSSPADEARPHRNPTWERDELILAMDVYVREGLLSGNHSSITELSQLLNSLPLHVERPDRARFRNANSVKMKLANFAALDPTHPGKGLTAGGAGDRRVWDDFTGRRVELHSLAQQLRDGVTTKIRVDLPLGEVDGEEGVAEGRLLYRRHLARERNPKIIKAKKAAALKAAGCLACEVCGFDFNAFYGALGDGYMEAHHIVPLSEAGESTTKLADLILVCSNCHRMLHSRHGWVKPDALRAALAAATGEDG